MSSTPIRDALLRQLRQVQDKLEGLKGDRVVTIYLDDVVSVTVSLNIEHLSANVDSKIHDIYDEENKEAENKYFPGGKSVQS